MDAPSTVPQAALDRFANRSRARCILVFIVGYLVWQPLAQLILHFFGKPLAFRTGSQWAYFLLVMGCLGGAVGAGWYTVQRLRAGWRRDWFDNSLRMVAFGSAIFGSDLATDPLGLWLIAAVSSSAFVAVFGSQLVVSRLDSSIGMRRPNQRLKLTAPGYGRSCVCALAGFVLGSRGVAPTGVRRRSLSAVR